MDTETGKIVFLDDTEAILRQKEWEAWEAGLLSKRPRFAPIKGDKIAAKAKPHKKSKIKTYRSFCN